MPPQALYTNYLGFNREQVKEQLTALFGDAWFAWVRSFVKYLDQTLTTVLYVPNYPRMLIVDTPRALTEVSLTFQ